MNSNTNMASIDKLYEEVKKGAKTDMELFVLKAVDKAADALSSSFTMLFVIVVAMFTLFVNMDLSFFIVSGVYLILALVLKKKTHEEA